MHLAVRTGMLIGKMLPELLGFKRPRLAVTIIAAPAHGTTARLAAMAQQVVPSIGVVVAARTRPVAARVLDVQRETVLGFEAATAAIAGPGGCECGRKAARGFLRGGSLADFRAVCVRIRCHLGQARGV
jgi:hypothetical protein